MRLLIIDVLSLIFLVRIFWGQMEGLMFLVLLGDGDVASMMMVDLSTSMSRSSKAIT